MTAHKENEKEKLEGSETTPYIN